MSMNNASSSRFTTMIPGFRAPFAFVMLAALASFGGGCHSTSSDRALPPDPTPEAGPVDAGITKFCDLPGSVQSTTSGTVSVPGSNTSQLSFLHLPVGYCVHYFGNVPNARQLRFAPGGELFVASPTTGTTGGGANGKQAVQVLPDDNRDGYADTQQTFLSNLPSTQGLLFTEGYLYYQDSTKILRVAYHSGDRAPSAQSEVVADIQVYSSALHWPKTLDQADDGTIYVGNGGDQGEECSEPHPFHGGILKLDPSMAGTQVAKGF